ncbi:M48 family metallopeptidase [Cognatilysobacter segetis]|uniref:M48 family metallopeptidase n=1 Tax=Cognatilysobacter segetis TaxID=2492394 RepID=UPI001390601C|nr:M48 family metallopeptidase [Lysobacter segetis]
MQSAAAYGALVERLERQSREAPTLYRFKLAVLACFGFAVLGGSALLAIGMSAGLVVGLALISPILLLKLVKIVWVPVAFGWFLLKALWVRFDPPDGYRLRPDEAPGLFAEVERLRRETGAPKLAAILIDADLNAAAASVPRASGLLGYTHYLVLGLPLLQLLSREQMLAVIAHELGHFGGRHSRFAGWIYRVRVSWYRVLWALDQSGSSLTRIYRRFFNWYAPFFNAYSFTLARANEYQADAAAARVLGASTTGAALVRVHLGSERLDRDFWPSVRAMNHELPAPPARLYRDMGAQLRRATAHDADRLAAALAVDAGHDDTHPSLAQRLAALGVEAASFDEPPESAADALLGPLAAELEARLSQEWHDSVEQAWQSNHREHHAGITRLAALEALAERDADGLCEYARLVDDLRPDTDAVPLFAQAVAAAPDDAYSRFRLGVLLLDRGDAAGVDHVRAAMALDPDAVEVGAAVLSRHFAALGDADGQQAAVDAVEALHAARAASVRERGRVTVRDVYAPHGLDAAQLDTFARQMRALDTVKRAWVVRKHVTDDASEPPHFVVLIAWRGFVFAEQGNLKRIVDALDLPGSLIVITAPHQRKVARRVRAAAGEPTFVR